LISVGGTAAAQRGNFPRPVRPQLPTDIARDQSAQATQEFERLVRERLRSRSSINGYKLADQEKSALRKLEDAVSGTRAVSASQLAEARTAVTSPGGRFVLGALEMQLGSRTGDIALQTVGLDNVIDSGAAPAQVLPRLHRNRGVLALNENNLAKAELSFAKVVELQPSDAESTVTLAQIKSDLGKHKDALQLFEQAIRTQESAKAEVPQVWLRAANSTRARLAALQAKKAK
jgi:tetratricopeptide (TPR) repeat protein